jgi:formamidopyrimidine-DNA glycosylase
MEGPETLKTVEFLQEELRGEMIRKLIFCNGKYIENLPFNYKNFDNFLPAKVVEISCKGKFIYIILENKDEKYIIFNSLMLSGNWSKEYKEENSHCFIEIDNGDTLWYEDKRGFGTFYFTNEIVELEEKLFNLGPDVLSHSFKLWDFKKMCKKYKNRNITTFLIDQNIICGIGNYLKSEILFYSKISPLRKIGSLEEKEIELLFEGLRIVPRLFYNSVVLKPEYKIYLNKKATKTKTADCRITYWNPKIQL